LVFIVIAIYLSLFLLPQKSGQNLCFMRVFGIKRAGEFIQSSFYSVYMPILMVLAKRTNKNLHLS